MPPGYEALRLSAVDYDEGDNAAIEYLAISIPQDEAGDLFEVTETGEVLAQRSFDRADGESYNLTVRAADDNGDGNSGKTGYSLDTGYVHYMY